MSAAVPHITFPEGSALAAVAAEELTTHLARLGGHALASVTIGHGAAGEGFDWSARGGAVTVTADGPQGALHAVYDLLEALGFAWPAPATT